MSKYGEVPVLVDRSQAYVQSNAILLHLAQRTLKFYGRDAVDHDQVREWLFWEANRIGISVPNLRFALRWVPDTKPEVLDWLRARAMADLDRMNGEFAAHKFLLGRHPDRRGHQLLRLSVLGRSGGHRSGALAQRPTLAQRHQRPARLEAAVPSDGVKRRHY